MIDELINKQNDINQMRQQLAEEIVESQNLKTLEEAKKFVKGWIEEAHFYASNEEYWRERALKAESK